MFFGNMQSFYRRNSIHNTSQSSKQTKDHAIRKQSRNRHSRDDSEDRRSRHYAGNPFSTLSPDEEPASELQRPVVPAIKIGMFEPETSRKSFNILKEKEKALWCNNDSLDSEEDSERLGPNKNNIIEETLECERRKSGDWGN